MNKIQKTIWTIYSISLVAALYLLFIESDGGRSIFLVLIGGTPLSIFLSFLWRKKN